MAIEGKVRTLFTDKTQQEALFPRTKTKAISDDNGVGLDATLSKIQNDLSNKATETYVANKIAEAQLGGGDVEIDLTGFATKDDLNNIDFPVDSVNGKTGAVTLSASDVSAVPTTRTVNGKKLSSNITLSASDVGAAAASSVGTNKVFNKLTDIGITTFPTTMKTIASSMPNNSTLMLDSRDIIAGGTHEISDLGLGNAGMYMFMRGNSNARLSLLNIYGATSATTSYMNFGCYAATNNSVVWKHVDPSDFAPSGYGYGGQAIDLGTIDSEEALTDAIASVFDNMTADETKLVKFEGYPSDSTHKFFGILSKNSSATGNLLAHSAYNKGSLLQKIKYKGTWQHTDWVNDTLVENVERRTAERYQGKVVYEKLVNFGALPNTTSKTVGFYNDGCTGVVSLTAMLSDGCCIGAGYNRDMRHATSKGMFLDNTTYNIRITTEYNCSDLSAYVIVKYTKD